MSLKARQKAAQRSEENAVAATTGYSGMTTTLLRTIDAGLSPSIELGATASTATYYCMQTKNAATTTFPYHYQQGGVSGNGVITAGPCT